MSAYPLGRTITIGPEELQDATPVDANATTAELSVLKVATDETITPDVTNTDIGFYEAQGVELDVAGRWTYRWVFTIGSEVSVRTGEFTVYANPLEDPTAARFTAPPTVAARLGQTFTEAQEARCGVLIELATGLVAEACGKDDEWAAAYEPSTALRTLTAEVVARAMGGTLGVRSESEALGAYSHSTNYEDGAVGTFRLSGEEELCARRIVFGSNSGSGRAETVLNDLYELDDE